MVMAKVERPLFSDEATGRVGTAISFKTGAVWNSIIPQFHRVQSDSLALRAQRDKFSAACSTWRGLSTETKQSYADAAQDGRTGFQYFLSTVLGG